MNTMTRLICGLAVSCGFALLASDGFAQLSQSPMVIRQPEPPLIMLTIERDEKLVKPAYNDYSDVDGTGAGIDVDYKPGVITYFGLFDTNKCYDYSTSNARFEPRMSVVDATLKTCGTSVAWSGDYLNYVTTTQLDALRKVFYGGRRSTDTSTTTVLERAYVPQDAHTWGKEYNRVRSSYLISSYTPFAQPTGDALQHMLANATLNGSTSNPPLLRVLLNRQERIWNWVAKEGPVVGGTIDPGTGGVGGGGVTPTDYVVRVLTCVKSNSFPLDGDCKGYPAANPTVWKPTGILHDYGENRSIAFGLLTGSYDNSRKGGVVRSNIGYFDAEINLADGTFNTSVNQIVGTLDKIRIAQWSGSAGGGGSFSCTGGCKDYGSPIAEMMYEGLRYFGGTTTPTSAYAYTNSGSTDASLGLPYVGQGTTPWLNPYRGKAAGGFAACSKPVQMVVSDAAPTFDSDDLPGSSFATFATPATPSTLASLNVTSLGASIWNTEGLGSKRYFIGHSLANTGNVYDQAPTAKLANSFGTIRGLAPGEPTREGSYYAASVAKFGAENPVTTPGNLPVQTYAVALTPPLPTIQIPTRNGTVSIIPFAKSVGGCNYGEFVSGTTFLTNRLAGFFFNDVYNLAGFPTDASKNSGRPTGTFRVSFEDNEQGTDDDMDAIVIYTFTVNADQSVTIELSSEYAAGCIDQNMGFVISGTTTDGAFLGVRDIGGGGAAYALNDPAYSFDNFDASLNPIYPNDGLLHLRYRRTFTASTANASVGSIPQNPLWYAAKYGVLAGTPWDANGDGVPDNYALVTNPGKLKAQISAALQTILATSQLSPSIALTGSLVRSSSSLGFAGRYSYGQTSVPRTTGVPVTSTVWEGGVDGIRINDNGTLGATVWSTSNASFPTPATRNVVTKIGSSYAAFTSANVANDSNLTDLLAPGSLQSILSPALTALYGTLTSSQLKQRTAAAVVNYLRGDQSLEEGNTSAPLPIGPLRIRKTIFGDIVHSLPAYQGKQDYGLSSASIPGASLYPAYVAAKRARTELVWVGANDGMLHALDARTGAVQWSFIPTALQSKLEGLTRKSYTHQYFMDGQIAVGDVYNGSAWRTIVVASAGAGARTIVAIDATNPGTPVPLWEVQADDIGYVLGPLSIARVNNSAGSDWAVIFGNGYETTVSVSGGGTKNVARLVVLDAITGSSLGSSANLTVPDSVAYNGMGVPALVGDANVSDVWVGDLGGNLWQFDLSGNPSAWALALPAKAPLFKAERASIATGNAIIPQPITAAPTVVKSLSRGYWVTFGTGKFFQEADRLTTEIQSIYSVRDLATANQLTNNAANAAGFTNLRRSNLTPFTISSETSHSDSILGYRRLAAGTAPTKSFGWYLDLVSPGTTPAGERVLTPPLVYLPSVFVGTFSVSTDVCADGSDGWFMAMDLTAGGESDVFDTNGDGVVNGSDQKRGGVSLVGSGVGGFESAFGLVANADGTKMSFIGVPGAARDKPNSSAPALSSAGGVGQRNVQTGRFSWRQIQ